MIVVLLFGSSGLVGSSIRAHLNLDFLDLFIYTRANALLCIRNGLPHLVESNLSVSHSLRLVKPDIIINAAGSTKNRAQIVESNIFFVSKLLFAISSYSLSNSKHIHFFQISSLGAADPHSFVQQHELNFYEISKKFSDLLILSVAKPHSNLHISFIQPSIVFSCSHTSFLKKLFFLFLLSPLRFDSHDFVIPLVPVDVISRFIVTSICSSSFHSPNLFVPLTSGQTLSDIHSIFLRHSSLYRILNRFKFSSPSFLHFIAHSNLQHLLPAKILSIPSSAFRRSIIRLYLFPTSLLLR